MTSATIACHRRSSMAPDLGQHGQPESPGRPRQRGTTRWLVWHPDMSAEPPVMLGKCHHSRAENTGSMTAGCAVGMGHQDPGHSLA